jgi:hypothetical protein
MRMFKFVVPVGGEHDVPMPIGATIRHVAFQGSPRNLTFWAEVSATDMPKEFRRFHVAMTGEGIVRSRSTYVGTALNQDGSFVGHLYEVQR